MSSGEVHSVPALTEHQAAAVRELVDVIRQRDGATALSDDARLNLTAATRTHLLVGSPVTGYAQLHGDTAEVIGDQRSVATLLDALLARTQLLTVWAHGEHSVITEPAHQRGLRTVRVLWQLGLPLPTAPPQKYPPSSQVELHSFTPADAADVIAVNATAFAHHPEQGSWDLDDLGARTNSEWFDPDGLILARRRTGGELLGFHFTKRHSALVGEVYVLAVLPQTQGLGLGRTLLEAGLAHLYRVGVRDTILYVDDDNRRALALYESMGFQRRDKDVQLRTAQAQGPQR